MKNHSSIWRVVVVEDQLLFRQLTIELLRNDGRFDVVADAADGEEGLRLCQEHRPDLAIVDLQIPKLDGIDLCDQLRRDLPETQLLVITAFNDPFVVSRLWEIGVAGYVEKEQPLETLRTALDAIIQGGSFYTRVVTETRRKLQRDSEAYLKILSKREQEVLRYVASGWTSRQIGEELGLSVRTVESHRASIMRKLELPHLAALIQYAHENGIRKFHPPTA